ncbi:MAG: hypothetical protein ACE5E4_01555 [Candidatus Binatia bacterium]
MKVALAALISKAKQLESLAMEIYVKLANRFPDPPELARFWLTMARHEAGHVGALEMLGVLLEQSDQSPVVSKVSDLGTEEELVAGLRRECEGDLSLDRAFSIAVELESAELEDLMLELVQCLTDSTQREQAENMLVHDLSDLSLMIEKYSGDEALLERVDALVERHVQRREQRRQH